MVNLKTEVEVLSYLRDACYNFTNNNYKPPLENAMCDTVFEDCLCWPATKAGQYAAQNCSGDFLKATQKSLARRKCTENGTWLALSGEDSIKNQCGMFFININMPQADDVQKDMSLFNKWLPIMKDISYSGYTVSILSLVLSIYILVSIKRLHCSRNKLHINLFVSFILRYLMSILKDSLFVKGTALRHETLYDSNGEPQFFPDINYSWVCKAIIAIRYYVIISNFMLVLMEGLYLHNLMFLKLFSDHHGVILYCLLGWGLPLIFIIPWIILRVLYEDYLCWTRRANVYIALFIDLPIGITVVINFILFLTIVRVLTVKLNNVCIQQRKIKYRKLLKATLILIPLFGVPYAFSLLMSIYAKENDVMEIVYLFFDQSFAAFQGFFAALVYCLLNSEVQMEIRRKYVLMKDKNDKEFRRSRTISNTQQFSLQLNDTEDNIVESIVLTNKLHNPVVSEYKCQDQEQPCYF